MRSQRTGPSKEPARHLPLSAADCHLLMALAREEMYGYALLQAMAEDSAGVVGMDIGALYRALDRLMRTGLIEASGRVASERTRGKPRRYYRLSPVGRSVLRAEMSRLRRVLEVAELAEVEGVGG